MTISSPYCLEFMKKGVNKAETLKKVLKILDISPNEVIVAEDIPQKFKEKLLSYDLDRKKYHRNIYLDNDWFIEYEIDGLREFHEESGFQFQITDLDKFKNGAVTKIFFLAEENDLEKLEKKLVKDVEND